MSPRAGRKALRPVGCNKLVHGAREMHLSSTIIYIYIYNACLAYTATTTTAVVAFFSFFLLSIPWCLLSLRLGVISVEAHHARALSGGNDNNDAISK